MNQKGRAVLFVVGLASVVVGVALLSIPAAFIVAGSGLVADALWGPA